MPRALRRVTLLVALGMLWAGGCDDHQKTKPAPRSSAKVELPPKPSLKPPKYQLKHADGALTVEGLLRNRDLFLEQPVRVKGLVKRLVLCEQVPIKPAPEKKTRPRRRKKKAEPPPPPTWTCKPQPHALLVDQGSSDRFQLRVGGTMASGLTDLKEGRVVVLQGFFDLMSPDGRYVDQQGLLYLSSRPKPTK